MKIYIVCSLTTDDYIKEIKASFGTLREAEIFLKGWMSKEGYIERFLVIKEIDFYGEEIELPDIIYKTRSLDPNCTYVQSWLKLAKRGKK